MKKRHFGLLLAAALSSSGLLSSTAIAAADTGSYTTQQDLNPNKSSTNRPIKNKWALVIGASKFSTTRLNTNQDFDAAARNFQAYLIDPHGGRFEKSHVKALINSAAVYHNLESALKDGFLGKVAEEDDLVVIFVATRGFPTTDGKVYLCAHDVALNNIGGTCMKVEDLIKMIKTNVKSKRIVLVIEASGSGPEDPTVGKALKVAQNVDVDKLNTGEGFIILSSSGPDQVTWGTQFSTNLIKCLRENDGMVSLRTAFQSARTATEAATAADVKRQNKQTPVMSWNWSGQDMVLGAPSGTESAALQKVLGAESHYFRALQAQGSNDLVTAQTEFEAAIKEDPYYGDALNDYGGMLAGKGDWTGASQKFEQAVEVRPDDALFHYNYARALAKLKKPDESLAELQKSYSLNNRDRNTLIALADLMNKKDEPDKALQYLQEALLTAPDDADLLTRISVSQCKKGQVDTAIETARQAIAKDPSYLTAYLNLGSYYLGNKNADMAAETYRHATIINPNSADAHLYLGKALQQLNQETEAMAEYRKFLDLCGSNDPRAEDTRKVISELGKI